MSQRQRVVLHDLRELGAALALVGFREAASAVATAVLARTEASVAVLPPLPPLAPRGDRPLCACGKVAYRDRMGGVAASKVLGPGHRVYRCPFGPFHVRGTGRSRRERSGR